MHLAHAHDELGVGRLQLTLGLLKRLLGLVQLGDGRILLREESRVLLHLRGDGRQLTLHLIDLGLQVSGRRTLAIGESLGLGALQAGDGLGPHLIVLVGDDEAARLAEVGDLAFDTAECLLGRVDGLLGQLHLGLEQVDDGVRGSGLRDVERLLPLRRLVRHLHQAAGADLAG